MGRRALVVDDDPDLRMLVRLTLAQRGFAVTEACDTAGALFQALAGHGPNLVVLDQVLDDVATGVELATVIAAGRTRISIVVLTGYLDGHARFPGVDVVLNKADIGRLGDLADELVPPDVARRA